MPIPYDAKVKEKLRIEAALRGVYSAAQNNGISGFLNSPPTSILSLGQISFIAQGGHRQLLIQAFQSVDFEFWVEGAAAVMAVCVPSYKGQPVTKLFMDQRDATGYLIPDDPEAAEIYLT